MRQNRVRATDSPSNGCVRATYTRGFLSHRLESWVVVSPLQPANYNIPPLLTDGEPLGGLRILSSPGCISRRRRSGQGRRPPFRDHA